VTEDLVDFSADRLECDFLRQSRGNDPPHRLANCGLVATESSPWCEERPPMLTNSLRRATSILVVDHDPTFRKGLRFSLTTS
jgi:hypothetical protein